MGQGIIDNIRYVYNISNKINGEIQLIVKFDSNVAKLNTNECIISIDSQSVSAETTHKIIMQVYQELYSKGIKSFKKNINIILSNEDELAIANELKDKINIKFDVYKIKFAQFLNSKSITKIDNDITRQYIKRDADDNNTGYLLENVTPEDMYNKLQEIVSNSSLKEQYKNYSEEELFTAILDLIATTENKKKYLLESPEEQVAMDDRGFLASRVANENDGIANQEIGVIENDPSASNEITTIEEDDDNLNIVEPETTTTIKTDDLENQEEEQITPEYYSQSPANNSDDYEQEIPNYSYKYDSNEEDFSEDNNEDKSPSEIAEEKKTRAEAIADEEEIFKELLPNNDHVRKRVLTNPNNTYTTTKSSGIITLPVIILIISGLLLIGAVTLYLITK